MEVSQDEMPTEDARMGRPRDGRPRNGGRPRNRRPRPPQPARRPAANRRPSSEGRRPASSRPRPRPSGRRPSQRRTVVVLSVLSAVVVAVGVAAFTLTPDGKGGSATPGTTVPGTATTVPASELVTFRDDTTGFSIKYPRSWRKADIATDGEIRLILLAGGLNGVSVRVQRTEVPTTSENIANIKAVTDGIVGSNATAKVLNQRQLTVNGMPGYYYLYTFIDEETGAEGAHGHYFLFRGRKMHSIIFQAIPSQDFAGLAAVFDQVAETFQSDPDLGAAPAPTATQPAPTTTTSAPPAG